MLERLERIERLDQDGGEPEELLAEVRALLGEAEAWSRREGAGAEAVERCRVALAEGREPAIAR